MLRFQITVFSNGMHTTHIVEQKDKAAAIEKIKRAYPKGEIKTVNQLKKVERKWVNI